MKTLKFTSLKKLKFYYELHPHERKSYSAGKILQKTCCDNIEFYISDTKAWEYDPETPYSRPAESVLWH